MPFQDLTSKYQNLQGTSLAVYDIGCKLHTLLLRNACTNPEEEAYKKINFLIRWPMIVQMQVNQGIKDRNERDVDIANKLVRVLVTQLLSGLREDSSRIKPQIAKHMPTWQNMIYIINLVEELILGSHQKTIHNDSLEQIRDVNVSLFKWVQKDFLLNYNGSNEKHLWAEWDLIEHIFNIVDGIYPDWIFKNEKNSQLRIEDVIFSTLEKCSADEFNSMVDILMHEGSPYKNEQQSSQSLPHFQVQKSTQNKAKGLLRGVLGGGKSHHDHQQNQAEQSPANQVQNTMSEHSFMRNLLNLFCIALTQSDTKDQVQQQLERFEKFIKYLMIVSETWKSRMVSTIYNNYQKKFSEAITFAFTFLFHEIHHTKNTTSRQNYNIQSTSSQAYNSNTSSPKEQMFNKQYAQCLKNLMIYYINIIEYQKMRYTPVQLESHVTACRTIFNSVLIKNYQGVTENLINMKDISRIKQSDYDDFPECFYLEEWKVSFFNSDTIKKIVKKQLNQQQLLTYIQKRRNYAQHYLDSQSSNDKTKDEILKRMQLDTIEVIGQLSAEEFERKNKVALMNDNFIREQGNHWKKVKQIMFGSRGVWRFNVNDGLGYLTVNLLRSGDGIRPYLNERFRNGFEFFENEIDLEKKIFSQIDSDPSSDLFNIDKSKILQNKQQIIQEKKKKIVKPINDDKQMTTSDDEEENKEEDEEEFTHPYKETQHNPIITFFSRTLTTREKISLKKQYINHLKEHIYTFRVKTKEIITDMRCSILKPFYQRPGSITLTSHDILFFDDLFTPANLMQEKDNIFFFKYQKKSDDLLYKIIPLQDLKEIQRRRFLGRKSGLEIFLMDNKSILMNFQNNEDREQFAKKIIRQRNQKSYNLKYFDTLEPKRILKKRELTEKWMQWKISNFDYIMQLNILSGRSYNDLSQYPVFPWILTDFTSTNTPDIVAASQSINSPAGTQPPPNGFRDLNKNMQLLGTAERQAEFKRKYDDLDSFESFKEKFHCGSHYSNPGIVLHYMSRLSPYIDALVELHGRNLDTPDRGFHSIQDSLNSALTDHADVRELIPEFYFCPEMFSNLNQIRFGTKQDGTVVDNVKLPAWCNHDPCLFVIFLREAFESSYVSQNISSWIDFIFGYKQKDIEAEKSLNLFSHMTYEDGIDLENVTDQLLKQSYQEQIYNYGQTPSQLFQKNKHPQKMAKVQALKFNCVVDNQSKIKVYKPVVQQPTKNQNSGNATPILLSQEAILKAKFADDQTIIGLSKDGTVTYFFWLSKAHELNPNTPFTCCEDKKRKFDNRQKQNGFEIYDRSIKKFDFPLQILHTQKCIMRGGFWDGKISICPIEGVSQEQQSSLIAHQSTVTAITATINEKTIITGSKSGDIIIWNYIGGTGNPSNESNWQLRNHICDHEGIISSIHINEEMKLYLTCSFDGSANLYNLWNDKFVRSFHHPKLAPIHSGILTQTPLAACCFFSREDHHWYSFTLNGQLLEKQREDSSHIISPQVIKDSHFMEKLVYGTEKGYLIFRQLPLLKQFKKQQVSTQYPVLSIIVSPERRFLLVGCGDGGLNVVTEPFQISQLQSQIQSSNITSQISTQSNTSNSQNLASSILNQNTSNIMNQSMASSFISMTQSSIVSQPIVQAQGVNQKQQQSKPMFGNIQQQIPNYHSQGQNQNQPQHQYRE